MTPIPRFTVDEIADLMRRAAGFDGAPVFVKSGFEVYPIYGVSWDAIAGAVVIETEGIEDEEGPE